MPIQVLRRLNSINVENELESLVFPSNESFESHWQLYLEHQTHPPRIRFGLCLLSPRDRCLRADIKLILLTTHGGQVIKEKIFTDHLFFLSKGDPLCSFINEQISPKIYLDIDGDLYQDVLARAKQGTPLNTDDCTILAYVRFSNELDIQPKTKAFDFSRRFTVDWKLTKFQQIIEQINQTRPPSNFDFLKIIIINKSNFVCYLVGNDRRFVSERFQFTHVKLLDDIKSKNWRLLIKYPQTSPTTKNTPLYFTIKCSNLMQANYGKYELSCKYERNVLRRFIQTFEDFTDNYTIEFFSLDELLANVFSYRHDFNENNGRFFTIDYLLFTIEIVQPLQRSDVPKNIKRITEPTVISLANSGNIQSKGPAHLLKSSKEQQQRRAPTRVSSMADKSPEQRNLSPENTSLTKEDSQPSSWDPFSDESKVTPMFPPISSRTQPARSSPDRTSHFQPSKSYDDTNLARSPRSFQSKQIRFASQTRLRFSNLPSASSTIGSTELPDNFLFLSNLYRSGLHSDITIKNRDRQWNLHKSILSARSIYFNQQFSASNDAELTLADDSSILEKIFLFLYTNQYNSLRSSSPPSPLIADKKRRRSSSTTATSTANSSFDSIRSLFEASNKYGIDVLALLCLQDMCHPQQLNINTAALVLICVYQAMNGPFEKYHSQDYLNQMKSFKQNTLRFIQQRSREILLSSQWKFLEKQYPSLVHDVLEFVVFEKIVE